MKIVIAGAGPVGCYTAQLLKKAGYNPVLLEEHSSVGKPVQCAGIVSKSLVSQIQSLILRESAVNQINGFHIISPWVEDFLIKIPGIAFIVDREKFDLSIGKGLDIHLGQLVSFIEKANNCYFVNTKQGERYEADILIGADGPDSVVRKFLLANYGKRDSTANIKLDYYFGMQYQIQLHDSYEMISDNIIQVFFDNHIPFFIWIIPENEKKLRIGVVSDNSKRILDEFISHKNIKGKIIDIITGKIPMGIIPTYYENIALVGDAACQIKPLTGGGLSYGMQSARILADCIKDKQLEKYDTLWKKQFGREIRFGLKAREIYENLKSKEREKLFHVFKRNAHFIEQVVDFDHHSILFMEALKRPQLLVDAGKLLRYYLEDMLKYS